MQFIAITLTRTGNDVIKYHVLVVVEP